MENYIGRLLDNRYEILEVIGTGGMAVVYKALCHRLNRLVAVKILKDEFSKDEEFHRRLHAESQAVAMLSHPNIVSVYDVSRSEDVDYIVMELIEGITLKQYLEKKGILNWRETLHFAMQIAKALEHAHSRGIIHRDIKPHNIMILKHGSVKVADFGIARIASAQNTLTREALGSVHYISPEQAKGSRVDNRTDLYSLGVVMYEMLTGRTPYDGETPVAVAIQHIGGNLLPPSQLNSAIPKALEQIVMHAMEVNPDKRYNSASEMLRDMEEFRKNPAIVFGAVGTEASELSRESERPARSIAEQKAGYAPKNRRQRGRRTEKNNLGVIIAIAACALVLVSVIIAFAVSMGSGGKDETSTEPTLTSANTALNKVPNFVGQMYQNIDQKQYPYLHFETEEENSSEEAGMVLRQSLEAELEIKGDRTILLTLSAGKKKATMEDLKNKSRAEAEKWLNDLKMDIKIRVEEENSEELEPGHVTRTDPAAGSEITAGDFVKLYLSKGKTQVEVPKVVGMSISNAYSLLTDRELDVEYSYENADEEKDTVIWQSITPDTEVDQGSRIYLTVSNGPKPTEPSEPSEASKPTEPSEQSKPAGTVKEYTMALEDHEQILTVVLKLGDVEVQTREVQPGVNEVTFVLEGTGTQYYEVYINDVYASIIKVNFDE